MGLVRPGIDIDDDVDCCDEYFRSDEDDDYADVALASFPLYRSMLKIKIEAPTAEAARRTDPLQVLPVARPNLIFQHGQ